ncbi:NAD(P)H-binding protein [Methyloversatilis sp. XJ19-13]|uniref:NAD(P)H-binding protein n=1 Tax=Methyloversatilis sp. XJ19-13 TaxID=2963430 RepID=UPI00211CA2B6|nr:NAD(P)H-binding protein [Methyloversatilis sp. XJ19-13]MCQ9373743.1 NAD(P)H-binding protein [Methyloversatilis sp. XJ19-13]
MNKVKRSQRTAPAGWCGKRSRVLIVGCGDVARRALPWLAPRVRVWAMVRNVESAVELRRLGVRCVRADLDDPASLRRVAALATWVWHFAPPPATGDGRDPRTRRLVAALARAGRTDRLCYISTSGVYGDCAGERVPETRPLNAGSARAARRVDAESAVRRLARRGVAVSILRAPGIYSPDRLPLDRLKRADPVLHPDEDVYTNHIDAADLGRLAWGALMRARGGRTYNASDDTRLAMGDYFDRVADAFALPRPPRVTREEARARLSPMMLSFMNESRVLDNSRMKRELRVTLHRPDVDAVLAHALQTFQR